MALAQDTDYILLDEPTTYLDIAHQLDLMRILRELANSGKGIVTVMHDLPLAFDFSDTLAVINNGMIATQATPGEIIDSHITQDIFGVKIKQTPPTDSGNNDMYDWRKERVILNAGSGSEIILTESQESSNENEADDSKDGDSE
jgi:ABC-type cobalamin/Fe3+-siderophores transport system ATPase subunit